MEQLIAHVGASFGGKVNFVAVLSDESTYAYLNLPVNCWLLAKHLVDVLSPFEKATSLLGGERYITMSLVIPVIVSLKDGLSLDKNDTQHVRKFKKALSIALNKKFHLDCLEPSSLPVLCTAMVPRFRDLDFLEEEDDRAAVRQALLKQLTSKNGNTAETAPDILEEDDREEVRWDC